MPQTPEAARPPVPRGNPAVEIAAKPPAPAPEADKAKSEAQQAVDEAEKAAEDEVKAEAPKLEQKLLDDLKRLWP